MCRRIFNEETLPLGEIPFFKIGSFGKTADAFISRKLYIDYREKFPFPNNGDILISAAGTIGRTVVYKGEDAYYQDSNIVWIDNDNSKVSNEFLYYILQIVKYHTEGGTIQRLYNNILKSTKFTYPLLNEQKKISAFLIKIDARIQTQNKIIEDYKTLKKGVMQKIFKQEIRFEDEHGKEFPKWEEKKLGTFLKHKSIRNKNLKINTVLSVSNLRGFILQSDQFDNHRVASKDVSNYKIVQKNDVAYNPSRINVGSIAILKDFETGIVSPMYVIFSLKNTLDSTFFENLISTHLFKHLVKIGCSGSVRDSLNFEDLESFKLNFPCIEEQQKIAATLSAIDKKIALEEDYLSGLKTQKKYLLQNLFV